MAHEYNSLWQTISNQWQDLALASIVGFVSGIAAWLHQFHERQPRLFSAVECTADILLSVFAANLVFMLCMWFSEEVTPLSWWAVSSLVGLAAHKASHWLFAIDKWITNRVRIRLGVSDDET